MSSPAGEATGTTHDLAAVWDEIADRLPDGWSLDGLRCASTGLSEAQRSEDWVAVASGPDGEQREHRASQPIDALRGLATTLESA